MKSTIYLLTLMIMAAFVVAELDLPSSGVIGKELPGPIGMLLGDQKINLHINMNSGEEAIISLVTENKVVTDMDIGGVDQPTLRIFTTESALLEVQSADDPLASLKSAAKEGRITYQAIGFFNKMKFSVVSMFVGMESHDYEVPEVDVEEDVTEEVVDGELNESEETTVTEPNPIVEDEPEEVAEPVVEEPLVYTVEMNNDGFEHDKITIAVGDSVKWENVRTGSYKKAMVIGTQKCNGVKSKILEIGESYSYTFNEAMTCTIVDGILTTQLMKVIIE